MVTMYIEMGNSKMPDKTLHLEVREWKAGEKKKWTTDLEAYRLSISENNGITSKARS